MTVRRGLAALFVLAALPAGAAPPDQLYLNGRIWTGDPARPRAEALAVRGDRLVAVGSSAALRTLAGPQTAVVDLQGRFVAPGFDDAHAHFLVVDVADLGGAEDLAEIEQRLAAWSRTHGDWPWLRGRGFAHRAVPTAFRPRTLLDALAPDRPAFVSAKDAHSAWVNTRALEAAGITRDTADPPDGRIERDAEGEATGLLIETAMLPVRRLVPPPGKDVLEASLRLRLAQAAAAGLTSVQNASLVVSEMEVFERARVADALTVRFSFAYPMAKDPTAEDRAAADVMRRRYGGPMLKVRAIKGVVDGVLESETALLEKPYADGRNGTSGFTQGELDRAVAAYDDDGWQVELHAMGDRAIDMALTAYQHAAAANGPRPRRHRVEHVALPRPRDLARFRAAGVVASTQPLFANARHGILHGLRELVGAVRAAWALPLRGLDAAGAVQPFGSDWPVTPLDPLGAIAEAAARGVGVETALRHATWDAAYASFDERDRGSLCEGKLADFVVLSEDLLAVPPARRPDVRLLLTVMGGRVTYRADPP